MIDRINTGRCDDLSLTELKQIIDDTHDRNEIERLSEIFLKNIEESNNILVLTYSIKSLMFLLPLPPEKEEIVITQLVSILKVQLNSSHKMLQDAITKFLLYMIVSKVDNARFMMPELISCLDDRYGTIGTNAYDALKIIAAKKPEYFEYYSGALIKLLGSINKSTRAETARLVGIIARTHPEYVEKALPTLEYLSNFYPDSHVKRIASEAYQTLSLKLNEAEEKAWPKERSKANMQSDSAGVGLADLLRRKGSETVNIPETPSPSNVKSNINEPNKSYGGIPGITVDKQSASLLGIDTEINDIDLELKELMEKVKDDFSLNAESILDSIGMGHMSGSTMKEIMEKNCFAVNENPEKFLDAMDIPSELFPSQEIPVKEEIKEPEKITTDIKCNFPPENPAITENNADSTASPVNKFWFKPPEKTAEKPDKDTVPQVTAAEEKTDEKEVETTPSSILARMKYNPADGDLPEELKKPGETPATGLDSLNAIGPIFTEISAGSPENMPANALNTVQANAPVPAKDKRSSIVLPVNYTSKSAGIKSVNHPIKPIIAPLKVKKKEIPEVEKIDAGKTGLDGSMASPVIEKTIVKDPLPSNDDVKFPAADMLKSPENGDKKEESLDSDMIYCPTCNTVLPSGAQFCISCGTRVKEKQRIKCENCGTPNMPHARFCMNCGSAFKTDNLIKGHYDI
ncbi:zinc-ribbon domain-containing protein [Methanooceanicella nereidis]|uniref:zinc-ribbon domain-containing protein n=1 Tax=Methanooceanicella nereidis TaxID=2052831 RepID=UPI001E5D9683|nr:zinc-ribbon domain-containing protein [Methanocella sp. CWC-04]